MSDRFEDLDAEIAALIDHDRLRTLLPRRHAGVCFEQAGRMIVNFGSNDYLGLACESVDGERIAERQPVGSGASSLVSGWTDSHERLAVAIGEFEDTESAVVFPSGFAACSGAIATLARAGDLIVSDRLNHASLIDGCRLSRANCLVYPHRDAEALRVLLEQNRSLYARVWIVTDGVFSMDGSIAPLAELCKVAQHYEAELIVDEAHATGVLGESGGGLCEALGLKEQVAIRIGTLSKAVGVQGGFVAGPKSVIDYLVNCCRSLIYSTSLSPVLADVASKHIEKIRLEPERRERVKRCARRFREALGISSSCSIEQSVPIIPIILGDERAAMEAADLLLEQGFYVPAIRPPTVPDGTARLRISLSAAHPDDRVDGLIGALHSIK